MTMSILFLWCWD